MGDNRRRFMFPRTYGENVILYTTTDGNIIDIEDGIICDANILSNTYDSVLGGKIVFDSPVEQIKDSAFKDNTTLQSIILPDSVTVIESTAFHNCQELISIDTGNGILEIKDTVFSTDHKLSNVILGNNITKIGNAAFSDCISISNINFPETLIELGELAFYACSGLTEIIIPDSVVTIGIYAFSGCSSVNYVSIGRNLVSLGEPLFSSCSGTLLIKSEYIVETNYNVSGGDTITYNKHPGAEGCLLDGANFTTCIIGDNITTIGEHAFEDCSTFTKVVIPNSIINIRANSFAYCTSLISVDIPDSVVNIGSHAFYGCSSLIDIKIGDGVTLIAQNAFLNCTSLQCAILGTSVNEIGTGAFGGCTSLNRIYSHATTAPTLDYDAIGAFNEIQTYGTLVYPSGSDYSSWLLTDEYYLGYYNWNAKAMNSDPLKVIYATASDIGIASEHNYILDMGEPIAIQIVSANSVSDNNSRIIPLRFISLGVWSTVSSDTPLENYNRVPITTNVNVNATSSAANGYLPSDKFSSNQSYVYPSAYYVSNTSLMCPAPQFTVGMNEEYSKDITGYNNALSDIYGLNNTNTLSTYGSTYTANYKVYNTFRNSYNTIIDAEWYLPGLGELGYLMLKFKDISALLSRLGGQALPNGLIWSSTETSDTAVYTINTNTGLIQNTISKTGGTAYIVPFAINHY